MNKPAVDNRACSHGFIQASCGDCNLKGLCLPIAMDIQDIDRLSEIIQRGYPLQAGDYLFHHGDPFTSIYAVRSGSLKTCLSDDNGVDQVTGFYLPGEILGFDGIDTGEHRCSAIALDTASICAIPFDRLEELSRQIPTLQHHFFQLMSRQIESNQGMMMTLGKKNADSRLATLLMSLSRRASRRNLSASAMRLPMSRQDIAHFLGLTIETVSRTFSRLQKDGLIAIDGRELRIVDHVRLDELCRKGH